MNNHINKIRIEEKLTLAQLSKLTNLSIGYLCHLENGSRKNPSMKVMEQICLALNRDLQDIFYL